MEANATYLPRSCVPASIARFGTKIKVLFSFMWLISKPSNELSWYLFKKPLAKASGLVVLDPVGRICHQGRREVVPKGHECESRTAFSFTIAREIRVECYFVTRQLERRHHQPDFLFRINWRIFDKTYKVSVYCSTSNSPAPTPYRNKLHFDRHVYTPCKRTEPVAGGLCSF